MVHGKWDEAVARISHSREGQHMEDWTREYTPFLTILVLLVLSFGFVQSVDADGKAYPRPRAKKTT